MSTANICSSYDVAEKKRHYSKFSKILLSLLLAGLITAVTSFFLNNAVIALFPLSLLFLTFSMSNLPSNLKEKIPSEF
jgi:hypothetical protein